MKISSSFLCLAVLATAFNTADAQFAQPFPGAGQMAPAGPAVGQSAFRQTRGDVQTGLPGRLWFETNVADQGLGYNGSYLTLGAKRRLFEDFLDGRWLVEGQLHHSIDETENDFFTNIGIERVFSVPAAGADVSIGGWYDFNEATDAAFSNDFHQVSVSGSIKTRRWDLMANGYFPLGETDKVLGGAPGLIDLDDRFAVNNIYSRLATDLAQTGFDTTLRFRPKQLAFANGTFDLGGYGYKSDRQEFFGGGRARVGFQAMRGAIVSAEVNYDEQFKTTGRLGLSWTFGANGGRGSEYAGIGRDFESTERNDHIVRVTDAGALVINPKTNEAYNVQHVNNERGVAGAGDGTFENPFASTTEAAAASGQNDVIFVATGDGSQDGLRGDIILQDGQLLLGDGGAYAIPNAANGTMFNLITSGGTGPTLSRSTTGLVGAQAVVSLADCNTIAGLNVDATGRTHGIFGNGVDTGRIEDVTVTNAASDGLRLEDVSGTWDVRDSGFSNNGGSGLAVQDALNADTNYLFQNNIASNNFGDGISLRNFDANSVFIDANTTSDNVGNGLVIEDFVNTNGNGVNITNHTSDGNSQSGILANRGNGKLLIIGPTVTNNSGKGIDIRNYFSNNDQELTLISGIGDTSANLAGNGGSNIDILIDEPGIPAIGGNPAIPNVQNVLITNTTSDGSSTDGIAALANGDNTILNIDVRDDVSVINNIFNGISFRAENAGTINTNIGNPDLNTPALRLLNNGLGAASGISLVADGTADGQLGESTLNAVVSNVSILNDQSILVLPDTNQFANTDGITIESTGLAVVDVEVENSNIGVDAQTPGLDVITGVDVALANLGNGSINRIELDRLNIIAGGTGSDNVGTGISVSTAPDTFSDIAITDTTIRPNGVQNPGNGQDNEVFTDQVGNQGIVITANGTTEAIEFVATPVEPPVELIPGDPDATPPTEDIEIDITGPGAGIAGPGNTVQSNAFESFPGEPFIDGGSSLAGRVVPIEELASDGTIDNRTRVTLRDNTVQDFTFNGVDISTGGDARLSLIATGNRIINNGAGLNDDSNNDNVIGVGNGRDLPINSQPEIAELLFYDGINIDAFDDSLISARILGNDFTDNFERGLSLNTFHRATINAIVSNNTFIGNDRGQDQDAPTLSPLLSVGGNRGRLNTAGQFDIEAINNEEYYFRDFESPVFVADFDGDGVGIGNLFDPLTGEDVPADTNGVFIPGNTGLDIFGNPVRVGRANLNLVLGDNSIEHGVDDLDFSFEAGAELPYVRDVPTTALGGDFTAVGLGRNADDIFQTPTDFGIVDALIQAEQDNTFVNF